MHHNEFNEVYIFFSDCFLSIESIQYNLEIFQRPLILFYMIIEKYNLESSIRILFFLTPVMDYTLILVCMTNKMCHIKILSRVLNGRKLYLLCTNKCFVIYYMNTLGAVCVFI